MKATGPDFKLQRAGMNVKRLSTQLFYCDSVFWKYERINRYKCITNHRNVDFDFGVQFLK